MVGKRKLHSAAFKGDRTISELAGHFSAHPTLIHNWRKQLLAGAEEVFANGHQAAASLG